MSFFAPDRLDARTGPCIVKVQNGKCLKKGEEIVIPLRPVFPEDKPVPVGATCAFCGRFSRREGHTCGSRLCKAKQRDSKREENLAKRRRATWAKRKDRSCLYCQRPIVGRSDKQTCNDPKCSQKQRAEWQAKAYARRAAAKGSVRA
jgi:hypothetical protein